VDLLISLDSAHARRIEGPDREGDPDAPIWSLRTVEATVEDWEMETLGEGLTVTQARELAEKLGYGGRRYLD
jgi:hypothetical protein